MPGRDETTTAAPRGLSDADVAERVAKGQSNTVTDPTDRTVAQIVRANVLTPVNAIMIVLFLLVLISGHWKDGLFVGVVFSNALVGVTQEVRVRRELARLEVITAADATVIRNGTTVKIGIAEIVIDDLVVLATGDQASVDGTVVACTGLQMDESMLTGEADPVHKLPGDTVMSGSFVVAGHGRTVTTAVGDDSYANSLTTEARTFNDAESLLRQAINRILRWLTIIIPIASALLLISLLGAEDRWQDALQGTVAAAVAMVPDGLVLLTSLAFVAGVLELTKRNALAKQLSTVEILARVDVLCLDKTGTITTGEIKFVDVHPLGVGSADELRSTLVRIAHADDSPNATMAAIVAGLSGVAPADWTVASVEPFSSARKWSAVAFVGHGWFYVGAPDFLLGDDDVEGRALMTERSNAGMRLLALVSSDDPPGGPDGDALPVATTALAIVELEDELRHDAAEILAYFANQQVTLKVISGDNPETVSAIALRAGLRSDVAGVDARKLPRDNDELADALEAATVFGRVAPRQKQAMVRALQSRGHVVAMTGDGVNDVLALKDADLGIAMGSGSAATRAVADLVLTDDSFSSLPIVVDAGRKVINNVERVANLFVTKAVYAVLLTLLIGVVDSPFPFLPRQLTLIGTFSIGVPGFFLALAPEVERVRDGFMRRVLRFSVPAGLLAGAATFAAYQLARATTDITLAEARTLTTLTLLGLGLVVLAVTSRPMQAWKLALVVAMAAGYGVISVVAVGPAVLRARPVHRTGVGVRRRSAGGGGNPDRPAPEMGGSDRSGDHRRRALQHLEQTLATLTTPFVRSFGMIGAVAERRGVGETRGIDRQRRCDRAVSEAGRLRTPTPRLPHPLWRVPRHRCCSGGGDHPGDPLPLPFLDLRFRLARCRHLLRDLGIPRGRNDSRRHRQRPVLAADVLSDPIPADPAALLQRDRDVPRVRTRTRSGTQRPDGVDPVGARLLGLRPDHVSLFLLGQRVHRQQRDRPRWHVVARDRGVLLPDLPGAPDRVVPVRVGTDGRGVLWPPCSPRVCR